MTHGYNGLGTPGVSGHDFDGIQHIKNTRHPIKVEIGGKPITLVTIAHCANALGRTTACVKH